jgi:hypothetical protein
MPSQALIDASRTQLLSWLPRGWMRHPGTWTYKLFDGLAVEVARLRERIVDLDAESNPGAPVEMVDEWEEALDLPDPLLPAPETLEERQQLIAAKLLDSIGHTETDLRAIAASLGYEYIRITRLEPFECGHSECGAPLDNDFYSHVVVIGYAPGDLDEALEAALLRVKRANADFFFETIDELDGLLIDGEPLLIDGEELLL